MSGQRGRPKEIDEPIVLYVRVPARLAVRLDTWLAQLQEEHVGMTITRADLVRNVLERGVEEHERARRPAQAPRPKKAKRTHAK